MRLSVISDQISLHEEEAFRTIQKEGYKEVELHDVFGHSIEECTADEVKQLKTLLNKYGLRVSNLASTIFFLCPLYPGDQVSLFNPTFYSIEGNIKRHLQYLKNACQIAKELDCPTIRIFPFRWPDNRKGPFGTKKDLDQICQNISKALEIAKQEDRILVLENCPYSHLPKGQMTLEVVRRLKDPHLQLLWDPANSYRAIRENVPQIYQGWSLEQELEALYPYIGHIHLKDYHYDVGFPKPFLHKALGDGDIQYDALLSKLREKGYAQSLSLEPEVYLDLTLLSMRRLKEFYR